MCSKQLNVTNVSRKGILNLPRGARICRHFYERGVISFKGSHSWIFYTKGRRAHTDGSVKTKYTNVHET